MADPVILSLPSEAVGIVDAIKTIFTSGLTYFDSKIYAFEDEFTLEDAGIFPFMNFDIADCKVVAAGNQSLQHFERHKYPIIIYFSVRNDIKSKIKRGSLISTDGVISGDRGLFDIFDDVLTLLKSDPTFGGVVDKCPYTPEFSTNVGQYQDGSFWIGRAAMIFEVYKDVCKI